VKKVAIFCGAAVVIVLTAYILFNWRTQVANGDDQRSNVSGTLEPLPPLNARDIVGVREITKSELLTLMSKRRSLSQTEKAQVDRGCPGLACLYQGSGLTRWPESAPGTRAYLRLEDALSRRCPERRENFVSLSKRGGLAAVGQRLIRRPVKCL
jgi:hypothetical protein